METEVERRSAVPEDQFRYRLLLARLHAGDLTTREAAEKCGLNYVSWSNWERGKKPRDIADVVEKVAAGLGVDRDWLMWGGPLASEERRRPLRQRVVRTAGEPTAAKARSIVRPTGAAVRTTAGSRTATATSPAHPTRPVHHHAPTRPPGHPAAAASPGERRTRRAPRPTGA